MPTVQNIGLKRGVPFPFPQFHFLFSPYILCPFSLCSSPKSMGLGSAVCSRKGVLGRAPAVNLMRFNGKYGI